MSESDKQYYEVPARQNAESIERATAELLRQSQSEVEAILEGHGVPHDKVQAIAAAVIDAPPEVRYEGSGSIAATIAIIVALSKLIKVLVPLLEPFSKQGAKLGYEIALDIWKMLKKRLQQEKSIRLTEKPAKKSPKKR